MINYEYDGFTESQHVSIGQIQSINGKLWIKRLADITNNEIKLFYPNEDTPKIFENRDRLWYDGPEEEGSIGIWRWSAVPNKNDPTKDYVESEYDIHSNFIEVINLTQCKSLSEVTNILTNWFDKNFIGGRVLFVYVAKSGVEGVLCSPRELETNGDKVRLLASVYTLPHYIIKPSDVIKIAGLWVYNKIDLGAPQSIFKIRTPQYVVKRILLSRVTIPALRENELTKKEAQRCKHFIENIPTDTIIQEISDEYACTADEAKTYVNNFIEHADTYLSENDFDINIISAALARNPELIQICKNQLSDEWENENTTKITEAQNELDRISQEEKNKNENLVSLQQKETDLNNRIQQAHQKLTETQKIAKDIEKESVEQMKAIQQNIAEFVTKMAFITQFINYDKKSETTQRQNTFTVLQSDMKHKEVKPVDDIDTFEEELIENLNIIGYTDDVAIEMAQTISFCICSQLPIVIQENSTVLAQCIAATIGGEKLTEVFVANQPSVISNLYELMNKTQSNYPFVYLIHGAFDGYTLNIFNEISNLIQKPMINAVIILSLQGIPQNMVFDSVWSNAFYINGDSGFEGFTNGLVQAFKPEMEFKRIINNDEFKAKKKELKPFSSILSNMQICWYAKYLATYDISLNESPTILNQIIAVGRSTGLEEELNSLFHENGISNGEKMLEQFL